MTEREKARHRAKQWRYARTAKGRAAQARYMQSAKGRATIKRYWASAKGWATQLRYRQSAKGRRRRKAQEAKRVRVGQQWLGTATSAAAAGVIRAHIKRRLDEYAAQAGFGR